MNRCLNHDYPEAVHDQRTLATPIPALSANELASALTAATKDPPDEAQHLLDIALSFDAGRKCAIELSRHPQEHLPEDLLFAGELVVERPPGDAGGRGQVVHADSAEAAFQEQALRRIDNGLARAAPAL